MATARPRRRANRPNAGGGGGQGSCNGKRLYDGGGQGVGRKPRRKSTKK